MTRLNYCIVWVHLLASTTTKITKHLLGQRDCWNTITWFTRICLKTVLSVRLYTLCPLCLAICCNLSFYVWGHALNVSFVFGGVLYSCRARGHVVKHFRWTCSAWYGDHALPGVVTTLQAVTVHTRLLWCHQQLWKLRGANNNQSERTTRWYTIITKQWSWIQLRYLGVMCSTIASVMLLKF